MNYRDRFQLMAFLPKRKTFSRAIKTSWSHPLKVDMLPIPDIDGSIGMTMVPGKNYDGFTGYWKRDLDADLAELSETYGTDFLISLMEAFEYEQVGAAELFTRGHEYGIDVVWYPIEDTSTPKDEVDYFLFVAKVVQTAINGYNIVIHCRGGIGRTGMTASCCLVNLGLDPYDAILHVRHARKGTITRQSQIDLVWRYAAFLKNGGG